MIYDGYEIKMKAQADERTEIVYAENMKVRFGNYATWEHERGTNDYYFGHYYDNEEEAKYDYYKRVKEIIEHYENGIIRVYKEEE